MPEFGSAKDSSSSSPPSSPPSSGSSPGSSPPSSGSSGSVPSSSSSSSSSGGAFLYSVTEIEVDPLTSTDGTFKFNNLSAFAITVNAYTGDVSGTPSPIPVTVPSMTSQVIGFIGDGDIRLTYFHLTLTGHGDTPDYQYPDVE